MHGQLLDRAGIDFAPVLYMPARHAEHFLHLLFEMGMPLAKVSENEGGDRTCCSRFNAIGAQLPHAEFRAQPDQDGLAPTVRYIKDQPEFVVNVPSLPGSLQDQARFAA